MIGPTMEQMPWSAQPGTPYECCNCHGPTTRGMPCHECWDGLLRAHEVLLALASHRKDVIEECAKVCETVRAAHPDYATPHYYHGTEECAAAIRALKEREAGA